MCPSTASGHADVQPSSKISLKRRSSMQVMDYCEAPKEH